MSETDDRSTRRVWLDRISAPTRDWKWPAALAMLAVAVVVGISQWMTFYGWDEVLEQIDDRSRAAACVDLLEEEFQRAISEVVIGLVEDDPHVLAREAPRLRAATSEAAVRACYASNG